MLQSLRDLPEAAEIRARVAVVGAGAAGISLAREFVGAAGTDVVLVESGGAEIDGETQALDEGAIVGLPYEPLESARARVLGGTTVLWSGWCKPLDAVDLAARPGLGLPGWPLGAGDLAPYYERAMHCCEIGPNRFDGEAWRELGHRFDPFDPERLVLGFWEKSPPTRFGERYRPALEAAPNIRLLLDANLVNVQLDAAGDRVAHLDLAGLGGRRARLVADAYVLACGGIENARLLLASDGVTPGGVGNGRDLVGRHFMEHPRIEVGHLFPADTYDFLDRYYRQRHRDRTHRLGWQLSAAAQDALGAANHIAEVDVERGTDGATHHAARLLREIKRGNMPDRLDERLLEILWDLGGVAESAWRKYVLRRQVNKPPREVILAVTVDPIPDPSSRITLGEERDALGMRRVVLDWRLRPEDGRGVNALVTTLAAELGRLGLARVKLHPALEDESGAWITRPNLVGQDNAPEMPPTHISWHHMGTTRMASDPGRGVVDADCRVHGVGNLYVAGSSVFPSTGNANPTLTIVALALRLADHLKANPTGPV